MPGFGSFGGAKGDRLNFGVRVHLGFVLLFVAAFGVKAAGAPRIERVDWGQGQVRLQFSAGAGSVQSVYRADGLSGQWTNLTRIGVVTPQSGQCVFTDNSPPDAGAFYLLSSTGAAIPIDATGLVGYWPLDGDWRDVVGGNDLSPTVLTAAAFSAVPQVRADRNFGYGPTKSVDQNGASSVSLTSVVETNGVTLEGWVWLPDDGSSGTLFGFGKNGWDEPKLNINVAWGFIWVFMGEMGDGVGIEYPRIGDTCWHHLALVLPKDFRDGRQFRFYLDGMETPPTQIDSSRSGTNSLTDAARIFGAPFNIGAFGSADNLASAGNMKVDEVRLWARELSPAEVAILAAPRGQGSLCENSPPPNWAPGARFVAPATEPQPQLDLAVRVLTDDTICIVSDPNPFLKQRLEIDCGAYLRAMETNRQFLADWAYQANYELGVNEVIIHYRPAIFESLCQTGHFTWSSLADGSASLNRGSVWPQATREFHVKAFDTNRTALHLTPSENVYFSFIHLPQPMRQGNEYRVTDGWGNSAAVIYDEAKTVSWAIKINQSGYLADAPKKFGYLGCWMGTGGGLDVTRFIGQPFQICRESDGSVAFSGVIAFRRDDTKPVDDRGTPYVMSGEVVCELDFSSFNQPGRYFVKVPGMGRSWSFTIGQDALGEAFYLHARGMYHQRCTPLDATRTAWARGDLHHPTYQAAFPTELGAYQDHSAEGWGFLTADGKFAQDVALSQFAAVTATKTTNVLAGVEGGWHDAGDYDRVGFQHLSAVRDMLVAYLMFPENFADGQLNIPESGNGIPDIVDEAIWGMEVWRKAQKADGRVALWINAETHPQVSDPGKDTQPYYLGLASRNSSLEYVEQAARLSRALRRVGATNQADVYLESARRAYEFGVSTFEQFPRVSVNMTVDGQEITWTEPPSPSPGLKAKGLAQLWLASGDQKYRDAMDSVELTTAFKNEVNDLYWRTTGFEFVDVIINADKFPTNWVQVARDGVVQRAEDWLRWMDADAYRHLWYAPGEGYFPLIGWGNHEFINIRELIAAWRITGDAKFRAGALLAMDWMQGANPQGRVYTTGLGHNYVLNPLHLPSDSDGIFDPVPGITIYGANPGLPYEARSIIYGLFLEPIPSMSFDGASMAQLPPPYDDPTLSIHDVEDILYSTIPIWRRIINVEAANPPQMEFTVQEVVAVGAAVTGSLLGPGWMPSSQLLNRKPRSEAELKDASWYQP